jgi:plasmid maintenance system antidote protein VapI
MVRMDTQAHPLETWIKQTRTKRYALADQVGVSGGRITQILSGQRPSPELAVKLEEVTGIDARVLLGIPIREAAE